MCQKIQAAFLVDLILVRRAIPSLNRFASLTSRMRRDAETGVSFPPNTLLASRKANGPRVRGPFAEMPASWSVLASPNSRNRQPQHSQSDECHRARLRDRSVSAATITTSSLEAQVVQIEGLTRSGKSRAQTNGCDACVGHKPKKAKKCPRIGRIAYTGGNKLRPSSRQSEREENSRPSTPGSQIPVGTKRRRA